MSAIWGMVDFKKRQELASIEKVMTEPYYHYKVDCFNTICDESIMMGYGGQYFTIRAKYEKLPIQNREEGIFFTADTVLDNREALMDKLKIDGEQRNLCPDGEILYQMFKTYGKECLNDLLGTYAFVYVDSKNETVYLVADALSSRSLYYYYQDERLFFSTLIKPIVKTLDGEVQWNYRWISDYLALDSLGLYTEYEETIYKGIHKVAAGQIITVSSGKLEKTFYWNPIDTVKEHKKQSDACYKEEFVKLFNECVEAVLASSKETGIFLSGGLDSTSVACLAAPKLKEQGKKLYSFTSIPEQDYAGRKNPYYITNEAEMVKTTERFLGNLSCSFIDMPNVNGWDGMEELMTLLELPFKAIQNLRWMYEGLKMASQKGCRIMLTGQYGNLTVSFGDFGVHFYTLLKKGKLLELMREVNAYHSRYGKSRKEVYLSMLKDAFSVSGKDKKASSVLGEKVYLNPELIEAYDVEERFRQGKYNDKENLNLTLKEYKKYMVLRDALMQAGEFETKLSLASGVLMRDPTRDKRMIEFCMSLPEEQFVYRGRDRRLVREYLKDYIPREVSQNYHHRGVQSADALNRLAKNWNSIYLEMERSLETSAAQYILNIPKIKQQMEKYKSGIQGANKFQIMKLIYSIGMANYINSNKIDKII